MQNLNTKGRVERPVTPMEWAVLVEENGKTYVVELVDRQQKIKGLGVFNPLTTLSEVPVGGSVAVGQKELKRMPPAPRTQPRHDPSGPNHWQQGCWVLPFETRPRT